MAEVFVVGLGLLDEAVVAEAFVAVHAEEEEQRLVFVADVVAFARQRLRQQFDPQVLRAGGVFFVVVFAVKQLLSRAEGGRRLRAELAAGVLDAGALVDQVHVHCVSVVDLCWLQNVERIVD